MLTRLSTAICLGLSLAACSSVSETPSTDESAAAVTSTDEATAAEAIEAATDATGIPSSAGFVEVSYDGRIYVLAGAESAASFRETHHLPYTLTVIGEGPEGETVVVEADPDDPTRQERLLGAYRRQHSFYAEERRDGRIYVLGSQKSLEGFRESGHLPYTFTLIGAGPDGETVVFEADPDDALFQERLQSMFAAR